MKYIAVRLLAVAGLVGILAGRACAEDPEGIFLAEGTNLFRVTVTDTQALLTRVSGLAFDPEPLGASPAAGGEVFMLSSTGLVSFNLLTTNAVVTPTTVPGYIGFSQGDLGTDGWFYITDSVSNDLWAIEWAATNSPAKRVGRLLTAGGLPVQVSGGDCGFAADGSLYLWSNWPKDFNAPRGLYKFLVPAQDDWPTNVMAIFEPSHATLTGIAVSKMGEQSIFGATWPENTIIQMDGTNAQVTGTFPLYLDGQPYTNTGGDMAVGVYSNESAEESLFLGGSTNLFLVTLTNDQAELTPVSGFSSVVGVLGASPAAPGKVFSLSGSGLASFDLVTSDNTNTPVNLPPGISISQGDVGPDGWFYFSDGVSNNLWALNPGEDSTLEAKKVGRLTTAAGASVSLHGADMGFASNGTLYVWSNWSDPLGLYVFQLPATNDWPTNIAAVAEPANLIVTGLAVSKTGQQSVVVSTWVDSTIVQLDPNGQVLSSAPMYLNGLPYSHSGGDMAIAVSTNGTPFDWLMSFGLGADGWNRDALADQDGDGMPSWQEYIAGTDPTNLASSLFVTGVAAPGVPGESASGFVVQWPSVSNRYYDLYRATNLLMGGFAPIAWNLPATPPDNVYTDIVEGLDTALYRIRVYLR